MPAVGTNDHFMELIPSLPELTGIILISVICLCPGNSMWSNSLCFYDDPQFQMQVSWLHHLVLIPCIPVIGHLMMQSSSDVHCVCPNQLSLSLQNISQKDLIKNNASLLLHCEKKKKKLPFCFCPKNMGSRVEVEPWGVKTGCPSCHPWMPLQKTFSVLFSPAENPPKTLTKKKKKKMCNKAGVQL